MITESGAVKVRTEHNANLYKELNKSSLILGIIYTVLGGIFLILYIPVYVIDNNSSSKDLFLLCFGALFLVFGIIMIVSAKRINNLNGVTSRVEENEFYKTYLFSTEYLNGEQISTLKFYYNRIVRTKETKNYIFIYTTKVTALSVDKNNLPEAELNVVCSLLKITAKGGAVKNQSAQSATVENSVVPQEDKTVEAAEKPVEEVGVFNVNLFEE